MLCYKVTQQGCAEEVPHKKMRKHGSPKIITTDKLASYGAAFCEIGIADQQLCGGRSNNRCENSHLPFRRQERAMQKLKVVQYLRNLPVITPRYTTTSIMKGISKAGNPSSKNAVPLSLSGSISVPHDD